MELPEYQAEPAGAASQEDGEDALIRGLPELYAELRPRHVWREFRDETGCRAYDHVRHEALAGDKECKKLMTQFALIYLKSRLMN